MSSTELLKEGVAPAPRVVDPALARRAAAILAVAAAIRPARPAPVRRSAVGRQLPDHDCRPARRRLVGAGPGRPRSGSRGPVDRAGCGAPCRVRRDPRRLRARRAGCAGVDWAGGPRAGQLRRIRGRASAVRTHPAAGRRHRRVGHLRRRDHHLRRAGRGAGSGPCGHVARGSAAARPPHCRPAGSHLCVPLLRGRRRVRRDGREPVRLGSRCLGARGAHRDGGHRGVGGRRAAGPGGPPRSEQ